VVALSPCLIPPTSNPLRFIATLVSIAFLPKLYDVHHASRLFQEMSLRSYLAYLPNGFWLVLRREPGRVPMKCDLRRLAVRVPGALLAVLLVMGLWRQDWSEVPFAFEHAGKVAAVILAVVLIGNTAAAGYRLLGGRALDPMANPMAARTPADFWRRWNRPAQQFLAEYGFAPAGGLRRVTRATLTTFVVSGLIHEYVFGIASGRIQGRQLLFFSLQGCATLATLRARPTGPRSIVWIAGTALFNLTTSVLFFQSVDDVLPFYCPRGR
jgi:hypothetical protein